MKNKPKQLKKVWNNIENGLKGMSEAELAYIREKNRNNHKTTTKKK